MNTRPWQLFSSALGTKIAGVASQQLQMCKDCPLNGQAPLEELCSSNLLSERLFASHKDLRAETSAHTSSRHWQLATMRMVLRPAIFI